MTADIMENHTALRPLGREFYSRDTLNVARDLLGKLLVKHEPQSVLAGKIVEAEAYRGRDDPASHAYRGLTARNRVMFGKPGLAYVYFTYGNHYCLNVVTEEEGTPAAVLIRALEPTLGLEEMRVNRNLSDVRRLTNGPGKLTKAMGITLGHNGLDLTAGRGIFIAEPPVKQQFEVAVSTRIGIGLAKDNPWRFYVKENPFVSRR